MSLNNRIQELEQKIIALEAKIQDLSRNTEEKIQKPYTVSGGNKNPGTNMPIDAKTGLGQILANHVIWNDSEGVIPPLNAEPSLPTKGYNKHSHSRYSGGALIKDVLEIVEYVWGSIINKDSQQFWVTQPKIATETNSNGIQVDKIGKLDLVFNPDTQTWGVAAYEIDVRKCYLVEHDEDGNIKLDANGNEMKSPLFNDNELFSSVIWDKDGRNGQGCWRFLSVYASGDE
jgi:hypothetical protein